MFKMMFLDVLAAISKEEEDKEEDQDGQEGLLEPSLEISESGVTPEKVLHDDVDLCID